MKTWTIKQLRDALANVPTRNDDLEVILRVQDDDGVTMVGGLFHAYPLDTTTAHC